MVSILEATLNLDAPVHVRVGFKELGGGVRFSLAVGRASIASDRMTRAKYFQFGKLSRNQRGHKALLATDCRMRTTKRPWNKSESMSIGW